MAPFAPTPLEQFSSLEWVRAGAAVAFPVGAGAAIKHGESQIAVFNQGGKWFATQNMCPHRRAFVLSQGLVGDHADGGLKVACPLHKKTFDLATGKGLDDPAYSIMTFKAEVRGDAEEVYVQLPPAAELDAVLGTQKNMLKADGGSAKLGSCGADAPGVWPEATRGEGFVGHKDARRVVGAV